MVKLGKLTDYGLVIMTCMARGQTSHMRTARDLAAESSLPISTVSKLLKELLRSRLLTSHRGIKGGYLLAREPQEISVIEMIAAIEGPMALTECSSEIAGLCNLDHLRAHSFSSVVCFTSSPFPESQGERPDRCVKI